MGSEETACRPESGFPFIKLIQSRGHPIPCRIIMPQNHTLSSLEELQGNSRIVQDVGVGVGSIHKDKIHRAEIRSKIEGGSVSVKLDDFPCLRPARVTQPRRLLLNHLF